MVWGKLKKSLEICEKLEEGFLLFFTGYQQGSTDFKLVFRQRKKFIGRGYF